MLNRFVMGTLALALIACSSDDSSSASKSDAGSGGSAGSSTGGAAGSGTGGAAGSGTGGAAGSGTGGAAGSGTGGAAGSGTGGAAGSGTGGAAGSGTGGAAGSGTGGAAGSGGGTACTPSGTACPKGQYCNAPNCSTGTCAPIPAQTSAKSPVCGCDGITYWNGTVAANAGISVSAKGACKPGKTCGGLIGAQCPSGTFCNYALTSAAMCAASDLAGSCWGLPTKCPTILIGPTTRACSAKVCASECDLIKQGKAVLLRQHLSAVAAALTHSGAPRGPDRP